MSVEGVYGPGWNETVWHLRAGEHSQKVPIRYYVTPEAIDHPDKQVHVYTGMGEDGSGVVANAQYLAHLGLPAVAAYTPYYKVDQQYLGHMGRELPVLLADKLSESQVDLFGRSRGGMSALLGGAALPKEYVGSVATLSTAGITHDVLKPTAVGRRAEMAWRLGIVNTPRLGVDVKNIVQLAGVANELRKFKRWSKLMAAVDYALGPELAAEVTAAAQKLDQDGIPLHFFIAERDAYYRRTQYEQALGALGLADNMTVVPGPHTHGRGASGKYQLTYYAAWLHGVRTERDYPPQPLADDGDIVRHT